ncbi:MAG TPA: hypothetical protein VK588_03240 [Chitinophagaceae bacterium]|nr:hypothetical protein [Chitinophagaceae bacterium]
MKKNLLFFILFAISLGIYGQPTIKIIAFEQENVPGTVPSGVKNENGTERKKAAATKNYFIFMTYQKGSPIKPAEVFIRGKSFTAEGNEVKNTPYYYTDNAIPVDHRKITLVPKTKNEVIELKLKENPDRKKISFATQKLIKENDVVVSYSWKQKEYFIALKKLNKLPSVANE